MKAGMRDYQDAQMREWTLQHPNEDFSPFDYLHALDKTFLCKPGTCQRYCSNGYSLLAFVTAAHNNATSWDDFDMMKYFPDNLRSEFNETILKFLMKGQCSKSPNIAH